MFRLVCVLSLLVACSTPAPTSDPSASASASEGAASTASAPQEGSETVVEEADVPILDEATAGVTAPALRVLLREHWDATMERYPTWASSLGDHRFDDRLTDPTAQARQAWHSKQDAFLRSARAIDPATLDEADRLTHALLIETLQHDVDGRVCKTWAWGVSPRYNPYTSAADLHESLPVTSSERAKAQLARVQQLPATFDAEIASLRAGLEEGLVANAASVELVVQQLDRELAKPVGEWPMMRIASTAELPETEKNELEAALIGVLHDKVKPAVARYRDLLRDEVLPKARGAGKEGLAGLPLGKACYGALVARYTTLPKATADERHQAGLDALKGIHAEFQDIGERAFGTRDLAAIFDRLRTDPALRFETEEQVEAAAKEHLARARKAMPRFFGRLPKAPCTVERIPEHEAPYTTIAYYKRPEAETGGRYFINTYAPETRPRHEAAVLAYHESIPGHHLQIAIAQELPDVPAFRRYEGMTAFVEGWGLYTERLADEMGLYDGDLDRLGMLSFDAWRAARLVVDTGLHDKGWSREQAEQFLRDNTPLALNNIANEVDRYITTPGQALAYKTGQQEIWRLRRQAQAELGDDFDIKAFHDVVLGAGAVSLPVLRRRVQAWIEDQKAG